MIYHIVDDEKVIDYAIDQFETVAPNQNVFLVNKNSVEELCHINNKNTILIQAEFYDQEYQKTIKNINERDQVVFHNLYGEYKISIAGQIPENTVCVGILWGVEIYSNINFNQIESSTIIQMKKYNRNHLFNTLKHKIKHYYKRLKNIQKQSPKIQKLFERLNYTATYIDGDYKLIKHLLNPECKNLWFSYYSIENIINDKTKSFITGSDILLGNSAFPSNNHISPINLLGEFSISDSKVIIPLNYGEKSYGDLVETYAIEKLKEKVFCLRSFLNRDEYNELLKRCKIIIMNHLRQQAMGNLITGLWFGAKVYLNENSNSYKYLSNLGLIVYSIGEDLHLTNKNALKSLSRKEQQVNREILEIEFSNKNVYRNTRVLVNAIQKTNKH